MPPTGITYKQWLDDTSLALSTRSDQLKALDKAFLTYERAQTPQNLRAVKAAFEVWAGKSKTGMGDATWSKRNHKGAVDRLGDMLASGGAPADNDSVFSGGLVPDFMHEELINARLGVLYLFGRVKADPGIAKLVLKGGFSIAKYAMGTAHVNLATELRPGGGTSIVDKGAGSAFAATIQQVGPAITGKIGGEIDKKTAKGGTATNVSLPGGVPSSQMANAAATTVYADQVLREAQAAEALANRGVLQQIKDAVAEYFWKFADGVVDTLKEKFGTVEGIAGMVKTVVLGCISAFAHAAAPFASAGMQLFTGTAAMLKAALIKFKTWRLSQGVQLALGHPTTVVASINRAMTMSIFEGLWEMLKGGVALGVDFVGPGAGMIANLVASISEMLVKIIWRLFEVAKMQRFFREAGEYYAGAGSEGALHRRPRAFIDWYAPYALAVPALSVITLNSGICGDKARWLTMYAAGPGGTAEISSAEFLAGARHLDRLKVWGAQYLDEAGFGLKSTGDVLVERLLKFAKGEAAMGAGQGARDEGLGKAHAATYSALGQVLRVASA